MRRQDFEHVVAAAAEITGCDDLVVVGSGSMLVAKVSAGARERGAHAGNLLRDVARSVGGGGGGRPDMAQAGVKDPASLSRALAAVPDVLGG